MSEKIAPNRRATDAPRASLATVAGLRVCGRKRADEPQGVDDRVSGSGLAMRSLHPNHIHLVSSSLCYFYFRPGGWRSRGAPRGMQIIEESDAYKTKSYWIGKERLRVWRYVLVDHLAACLAVRYYQQPEEDVVALTDFLVYAWLPKANYRHVFRGLPLELLWSKRTAEMGTAIQRHLEALGVEPRTPRRERKDSMGAVASAHSIVERGFESRLRFQPLESVHELNRFVDKWAAGVNADEIRGLDTRLQRRGKKINRVEAWQTITPEQLRELPDACAGDLTACAKSVPRILQFPRKT